MSVQPVVKNTKGMLGPSKFGGLSYTVLGYEDNGTTAIIDTAQFGKVKIFIQHKLASLTNKPIYRLIN